MGTAAAHVGEVPALDGPDPPAQPVAHDAPADVRDARHGEPELLEDRAGRRRGAEVVEPDDRALVADPALPAERHADLDADALADRRRQHLVAIRRVLRLEPLPAGERHDAGRDAVGLERLGRTEGELQLGARGDEDQLRRTAVGVAQHVAAARDALARLLGRAGQRRAASAG